MKLKIVTGKCAVNLAVQFPKKSVLLPLVFPETTRQRETKPIPGPSGHCT